MSQDKIETAKKYARAILEVLKENGNLDEERQELFDVKSIFVQNPTLGSILSDGTVNSDTKKSLLSPILDSASAFTKRLLEIIREYNRFDDFVTIVDEFEKFYEADQNIVRAEVTSAVELSQDQQDRIAAAYAQRVGAKKVLINVTIDPSIMGSLIVKSNDTVIDGSVKNNIDRVKKLLLN